MKKNLSSRNLLCPQIINVLIIVDSYKKILSFGPQFDIISIIFVFITVEMILYKKIAMLGPLFQKKWTTSSIFFVYAHLYLTVIHKKGNKWTKS